MDRHISAEERGGRPFPLECDLQLRGSAAVLIALIIDTHTHTHGKKPAHSALKAFIKSDELPYESGLTANDSLWSSAL